MSGIGLIVAIERKENKIAFYVPTQNANTYKYVSYEELSEAKIESIQSVFFKFKCKEKTLMRNINI